VFLQRRASAGAISFSVVHIVDVEGGVGIEVKPQVSHTEIDEGVWTASSQNRQA
jgi:hypothetical protein